MEQFDKNDLKSIFVYIRENFGIWCFRDKRFMWMLANLSPKYGKEKMRTFANLDDYGLLMKIVNNCNSSLNEKNEIVQEALNRNSKCNIDKNGEDLGIFIDVIDYFNTNNDLSKFSNPITIQNQPDYFKKIITDSKNIMDLDLIHCKAGSFMMGSPENELGRLYTETQHKVTLTQDFLLAKFMHTDSMGWKDFKVYDTNSDEYKNLSEIEKSEYCRNYEYYLKGKDSLAPTCLTRSSALYFCNKLNIKFAFSLPAGYAFTLPTEAQWEYACRAGTTTALYNGKNLTAERGKCRNLDEIAWYQGNTGADIEFHTHGTNRPVGGKAPNAWGFYDMLGLLWEYCFDLAIDFSNAEVVDPCYELISDICISEPEACRGGSFVNDACEIRSASRLKLMWSGSNIGMRVALAPIHNSSGEDVRYHLRNS